MTKKFEFNWQIPVPEPLLVGAVFDRWTEEKDNIELELACTFKVDEYGFFIYWKSEGRVSTNHFTFYGTPHHYWRAMAMAIGISAIWHLVHEIFVFKFYITFEIYRHGIRDGKEQRTKNEHHTHIPIALFTDPCLSHSPSSSYLFIFALFTIFRALDGFFSHLFC